MIKTKEFMDSLSQWSDICLGDEGIDLGLHEKYGVKRGLRDKNENGVAAGLTKVSKIEANKVVDGVKVPCEGKLSYGGYNIYDLIGGVVRRNRYGLEEIAYLLLFGRPPNAGQLTKLKESLTFSCIPPTNFVRDVIVRVPAGDMVISLSKSTPTPASYGEKTWDITVPSILRQCMMLTSVISTLAVYDCRVYNYYKKDDSMCIHRPGENPSTAENLLRLLRPDMKYSQVEAHVLDLTLTLHIEHGGGSNSTFTTYAITSSGIDTYSVISTALAPLRGPKHDRISIKAVGIMQDLRNEIKDVADRDKVEPYLKELLHKEASDHKGPICGVGHAMYSKSDPHAGIFKHFVRQLSEERGRMEEFALYSMVKELGPKIITEERRICKGVNANVDFYSGFVYSMLDIPEEMFTPIFVIAGTVGWGAHCIEELINMNKIIRPAYTSITEEENYKPPYDRQQELFPNLQVQRYYQDG